TVHIVGRGLNVQVNVSEVFIDRKRAPDSGIARRFVRIVQPGLGPGLPLARDCVEDPFLLSRSNIKRHHIALDVGLVDAAAWRQGRADDHGVVRYDNRRTVADLSDRGSLVVEIQFIKQIDDSVFSKARYRCAIFRVQRDQLEARGGEQDTLIASTVSPVGHAPMDLAGRSIESLTFVGTVDPKSLASRCIGSDDKAALIHREIKNTVDHDRRRLAAGLRVWSEAVRLPDPRDLQIFDVFAIDLIKGRVVRAAVLGAVNAPFSVLDALLSYC